jgi:hypothetical protein
MVYGPKLAVVKNWSALKEERRKWNNLSLHGSLFPDMGILAVDGDKCMKDNEMKTDQKPKHIIEYFLPQK